MNTCIDCGSECGQYKKYKCLPCWTKEPTIPVGARTVPYPPPAAFIPRLAGSGPHPVVSPNFTNTAITSALTSGIVSNYNLMVRRGYSFGPARFNSEGLPQSPQPPKKVNTCWGCTRELSTYLDAYYGTNPVMGGLCSKCRGNV